MNLSGTPGGNEHQPQQFLFARRSVGRSVGRSLERTVGWLVALCSPYHRSPISRPSFLTFTFLSSWMQRLVFYRRTSQFLFFQPNWCIVFSIDDFLWPNFPWNVWWYILASFNWQFPHQNKIVNDIIKDCISFPFSDVFILFKFHLYIWWWLICLFVLGKLNLRRLFHFMQREKDMTYC